MNDDTGFLEAMNDGMDPMAVMEQTAQQINKQSSIASQPEPKPGLFAQSTTRISSNANVLTGLPVNLNEMYNNKMKKNNKNNDNGFSNIQINLAPPKKQQQSLQQPQSNDIMDDDLDNYDPKNDLTPQQQQNGVLLFLYILIEKSKLNKITIK